MTAPFRIYLCSFRRSARTIGGPLDGNDPGPAMVPVLAHVDSLGRGGHGLGLGGGGGGGGSNVPGGFFSGTGAPHLVGGSNGPGGAGGIGAGSRDHGAPSVTVVVGGGGGGAGGGAGGGIGGGIGGGVTTLGGSSSSGVVGGGVGGTGGGGAGGLGEGDPSRLRIEASSSENLVSFEPAFTVGGGGGGGAGGAGGSPTAAGGTTGGGAGGGGGGGAFQGTGIETQQYELQMRMVDILVVSLQYARALRYGQWRANRGNLL